MMGQAFAAAVKKIAVYILKNREHRNRFLTAAASIVVAFVIIIMLPAAAIYAVTNMDIRKELSDASVPDDIPFSITETATGLEDEMIKADAGEYIIKAELIYVSYLRDNQNIDMKEYVRIFSEEKDDAELISSVNERYGTDIDYEDFVSCYTFVLNTTINQYMFTQPETKCMEDLARWAENACLSGWGYAEGGYGDRDEGSRIRCCDNGGLVLGYLNYSPDKKCFSDNVSAVVYTEQGAIDTMPDTRGTGVCRGTELGVYVGNGEVVFCSEEKGFVTREHLSEGAWTSWCTFEGVE